MRITSYDEAEALHRQLWRIDVVLFNLYPTEDGTDEIEGEYCEIDGHPHPYECFFDDYDEAVKYAATFDRRAAENTLILASNDRDYDHVAIEVNELDGMEPGYVVASHDWLYGVRHEYWHDEECVSRRG